MVSASPSAGFISGKGEFVQKTQGVENSGILGHQLVEFFKIWR